jgi:microcin C transport system ATP-binding protein
VLEVADLNVTFRRTAAIQAVRACQFHVDKGETVALVGESGSGKSVTALSTVGLLSDNASVRGSSPIGTAADGRPPERDLRRSAATTSASSSRSR